MKYLQQLVKGGAALVAVLLSACQPASGDLPLRYSQSLSPSELPVYRLAVYPLYNPRLLAAAYQPLVDHLNTQMPAARLELEASRDYPSFENKYTLREPAFLLPNPWQTLQAMAHGYRVIAMAGDPKDFRGLVVVRRDSGIKVPSDLKGKAVSYPAPTALAACVMPQYFLHTQGIDVQHDLQNLFVGSQESAIMNVYLGQTAAGATSPPPWRLFQRDHPQEAGQLQVVWETEPLANNSVMVRDDVPEQVWQPVLANLLALSHTTAGQAVLAGMSIDRFRTADQHSYEVVARYVRDFELAVRPIESR